MSALKVNQPTWSYNLTLAPCHEFLEVSVLLPSGFTRVRIAARQSRGSVSERPHDTEWLVEGIGAKEYPRLEGWSAAKPLSSEPVVYAWRQLRAAPLLDEAKDWYARAMDRAKRETSGRMDYFFVTHSDGRGVGQEIYGHDDMPALIAELESVRYLAECGEHVFVVIQFRKREEKP